MLYFDEPAGRVKIQTTSKNTQRYYTSKRLISDLLSNCFHRLAFLIVSEVKTLKIFKKSWFSTRAHTSTLRLHKTFSAPCENCLCRKLLTKNGRNLSRLSIYNSLKYWETMKTIELNLQLHTYSNKFVFNFNTDVTEYDKQDYTRLASAASKIICCKQTSSCTPKNALTYLHADFFPVSILLR